MRLGRELGRLQQSIIESALGSYKSGLSPAENVVLRVL